MSKRKRRSETRRMDLLREIADVEREEHGIRYGWAVNRRLRGGVEDKQQTTDAARLIDDGLACQKRVEVRSVFGDHIRRTYLYITPAGRKALEE